MKVILDGRSLTRGPLFDIAVHGAEVALDPVAVERAEAAREVIVEKVRRAEVVYGVTTGFGSNADRFLKSEDCALQLQRNLVVTHAVGVGRPMPREAVRAMMAIRINTLLVGHSGIRPAILRLMAEMLNRDIYPYIPEKGSVGASGDLAPLAHMAMLLLGEGKAFVGPYQVGKDEPVGAAEALQRLPEALFPNGERPVALRYKEGLALNNGTTQMTAYAVLALARLERLLKTADIAAAMALEAMAGRGDAFLEKVHALRPHPGQRDTAANIRKLVDGSTLVDIDFAYVPKRGGGWDPVPEAERALRASYYAERPPFRGGKRAKPQDSYTLRCAPQVHGAIKDAFNYVERVVKTELSSVTDNPLIFPGDAEKDVVSAGHFHGMPISLAMSLLKAAIPSLASICERRLNKLVDPATSDGLPAFLVKNDGGVDSGLMMVQYTAAALVNDLAARAHPASTHSIPTSANTEDHVSMGANEARHAYEMVEDLSHVLALELMVAAQALDVRMATLAGAYWDDAPWLEAAKKALDEAAWRELATFRETAQGRGYRPGAGVAAAHRVIRERISRLDRDRVLEPDIEAIIDLTKRGDVVTAVERALGAPLAV